MPDINYLDDCLSTRDGRLFIEELDTVELVREFGSPIFVLSEDQIRRNVRRFQDAFSAGWSDGPVKVMPAAKANWISAIQRILADEGCGCDIYSSGELTIALEAGFEPQFISVNGVPKDEGHIYRSIQAGARVTIDSLEEVDVIERAAADLDIVAKVRLRLKPVISGFIDHSDFVAEGLVPTDIAALAYKGGLSFDEVMTIAPRILTMAKVELVGFHQHNGRHHPSLRYWEEQMKAFAQEMGRVCQALGGYQPQEIDIGGGFAIPRDPHNAVTDYTEPAQLAALCGVSKVLNPISSKIRYKTMARLIDTIVSKPNDQMLQLEPGRSIYGDAGIHLATIRNIKRITSPIRWKVVTVDTTEFWFTGGRYEHHLHDYRIANKTDAPLVDKADIIGKSCYGDRLMPTIPIPEVEVGDIFAILDTGAYQEVSCSNFNAMPRPATVLVTGHQAHIIRHAETEAEVLSRDTMPAHLERQLALRVAEAVTSS
jgi:diaminopimelate decarboxylase